jgi:ribosomal protein S18 acetylase RimI-like enzyme
MQLRINELSHAELDKVVKIHIDALKEDVLPQLGREVLRKYYENVVSDQTQKLFGVFAGADLLGFCLISTSHSGLCRVILSKQGASSVIKLALNKPKVLLAGFLQTWKKKTIHEGVAEISFIAVSPLYQSIGVGKSMLKHVSQWCFDNDIRFLRTKTSNQFLQQFYVQTFRAEELVKYKLGDKTYWELRWATNLGATKP